ncbi:hypothetical protein ACETU7_21670 [Rhodococcus sp. 3Y1]
MAEQPCQVQGIANIGLSTSDIAIPCRRRRPGSGWRSRSAAGGEARVSRTEYLSDAQ